MPGSVFSITGSAAGAVASLKTMNQIASGTTDDAVIVGLDVSFDGVSATATPVTVNLSIATGASSGGSSYTPNKLSNPAGPATDITARVNDSTPGSSPTIQKTFYVPPTGGFSIQFPLGREKRIGVSGFVEWLCNAPAAVNYKANMEIED